MFSIRYEKLSASAELAVVDFVAVDFLVDQHIDPPEVTLQAWARGRLFESGRPDWLGSITVQMADSP
jgi:hypothetical protein